MDILVIGGTSFMGPYVIRALVADGHRVRVFSRGNSQVPLPQEVESIVGDHQELLSFREHFQADPPALVFHTVAMTAQDAWHLVRTFEGVAQRVVALSSMDVYQVFGHLRGIEEAPLPSQEHPDDESAPLRTRLYPYREKAEELSDDPDRIMMLKYYDKILVESLLMGATHLPATIIRLPAVYGPHDKQHRLHAALKRMDDGRPAILLDDVQAHWRWSRGYVEEMAKGIQLAITDSGARGQLFNLCEERAYTLLEWTQAIADVVGWKGKIITCSQEQLPEHLKNKSGNRFDRDVVLRSAKIRQTLNYKESTTLHQRIERTIEWQRAHPPASIDPKDFDYEAEDQAIAALGQSGL